jgi:hypothetical protein
MYLSLYLSLPSLGGISGALSAPLISLELDLTQTGPVKVRLVFSTLACVLTHWYCTLLISLLNLSLNTDLQGVISYTCFTHWVISSNYLSYSYSIHIQMRSAQLRLISWSALPLAALISWVSCCLCHQTLRPSSAINSCNIELPPYQSSYDKMLINQYVISTVLLAIYTLLVIHYQLWFSLLVSYSLKWLKL